MAAEAAQEEEEKRTTYIDINHKKKPFTMIALRFSFLSLSVLITNGN